jgi:NADPH2:quinone reductase
MVKDFTSNRKAEQLLGDLGRFSVVHSLPIMKAIVIREYGGPEVLNYGDAPDPKPGPGQAVVRHEAIGVNFVDVYHRIGLYPIAPPFSPGSEAAGVVTAVADDVTDVGVGDRVSHASTLGSYAQMQAVDAWRLVRLPDHVDTRAGAAIMLQGMTAHYLCHSTFPLQPGQSALIHAAAGGVGLLLIQIAKKLGVTVYGTVSTEAKAALALEAGADGVIRYGEHDFEEEVRRLTDGKGVNVVYDSVGKSTFDKSLNCLGPRGYMVLFGQASGPVPPVDPLVLLAKGSVFLTRPTLVNYAATRKEIQRRSNDLFGWYASGDLKLRIEHTYPLSEAAEAHRALEGRKTTGKVLLIP